MNKALMLKEKESRLKIMEELLKATDAELRQLAGRTQYDTEFLGLMDDHRQRLESGIDMLKQEIRSAREAGRIPLFMNESIIRHRKKDFILL